MKSIFDRLSSIRLHSLTQSLTHHYTCSFYRRKYVNKTSIWNELNSNGKIISHSLRCFLLSISHYIKENLIEWLWLTKKVEDEEGKRELFIYRLLSAFFLFFFSHIDTFNLNDNGNRSNFYILIERLANSTEISLCRNKNIPKNKKLKFFNMYFLVNWIIYQVLPRKLFEFLLHQHLQVEISFLSYL